MAWQIFLNDLNIRFIFFFLWLEENPDVILTLAPPSFGFLGHFSLFVSFACSLSICPSRCFYVHPTLCPLHFLSLWFSVYPVCLFFSNLPLFPDPLLDFVFNYIWKLILATSTAAALVHVALGACGYLHPSSCLCPLSVSQLEEPLVLFAQSSSGFLSQTAKSLPWPERLDLTLFRIS